MTFLVKGQNMKHLNYFFKLGLMLLCLFLTACSPETLLANLSLNPSSRVLFKDDFSNTVGGWSTQRDTNTIIDYENNGFRIWVNQPNFDYWSVPGLHFTDVRIEVDAVKTAGPDDNDYGIICRYIDQNNFYGFLISSDGYYGITKRKNGEHSVISAKAMEPGSSIRTGIATNHIRADCIDSTLTLYINGSKAAEITDPEYKIGDVGLLAGSFTQTGVDILFHHFVVSKP